MTMLTRFREPRNLLSVLEKQKLVCGNKAIAEAIAEVGLTQSINQGETLIEEGHFDNTIYLILQGSFSVLVKGKKVANRTTYDHVGEMAAIDPSQPRTSTVIADEDAVILRIREEDFFNLSEQYPIIWKHIAIELSNRLKQRNDRINPANSQINVFIISSVEALFIAQEIQSILRFEQFLVTVWTDGVFEASSYVLDALDNALDESDFAIVIAHPDDTAFIRHEEVTVPRDNIIFELGFALGRLKDKRRVFLMEPHDKKVKLPTDLLGLTPISYRLGPEDKLPSLLGPACHQIKKIVNQLGTRDSM